MYPISYAKRTVFVPYDALPLVVEREVVHGTEKVGDSIVAKVEVKEIDPQTKLKGLKCSDFSLQNLIMSGAKDLLHQVPMISRGSLSEADRMEKQFGNISSAYDDEKIKQSIEAQNQSAQSNVESAASSAAESSSN